MTTSVTAPKPATIKTISVLPLPPAVNSTTTLAQQPLVMQSGYCPQGYLPQYCGINSIGTPCTSATPIAQCIQQARIMGAYAANGCALGDQGCMMQQQMTGCPPGLLGGNCRQTYWNQMYAQRQYQQQQFIQGAMLGGMMGSALMQQMMRGFGSGNGNGNYGNGGMGPSSEGGGGGSGMSNDGIVGDCSREKTVTPEAQQKFDACIQKMSSVTAQKSIIVDADSNTAWVVDTRDSANEPKCYSIGIGGNSHGGSGSAILGNGNGSNRTPSGMLLTNDKKESRVFRNDTNKFCGLNGTNPLNGETYDRGVYLHACYGSPQTEGCICFHNGWDNIRNMVQSQNNRKATPIFVYSKNMKGSGCPGSNGSDGDGPENSSVTRDSGA